VNAAYDVVVTRVKWQIHGPVELSLAGAASSICARACVVTAPLVVLQDRGGALFLAGEATDHDYPGTVAGAIASGTRAARQALAVLDD